jgi:hypothetical protein
MPKAAQICGSAPFGSIPPIKLAAAVEALSNSGPEI